MRIGDYEFQSARNGRPYVVVNLEVVESTCDDREEGMQCAWFMWLDNDMGPVNLKNWVGACLGYEPGSDEVNDEVDEDVVEEAFEDQNFVGLEIYVNCTQVETKSGGDFTRHDWEAA